MSGKVLKVAVIGGESTGKSALCRALADHYQTVWVPEFARGFLEQQGGRYHEEDLLRIAVGQRAAGEDMLPEACRLLICDTDLSVIQLWSEVVYGRVHPEIISWLKEITYDLFLVTAPDLPWEPDPLREHPDPDLRKKFFDWYCRRAADSGRPRGVVQGEGPERVQCAIRFINQHLDHHARH